MANHNWFIVFGGVGQPRHLQVSSAGGPSRGSTGSGPQSRSELCPDIGAQGLGVDGIRCHERDRRPCASHKDTHQEAQRRMRNATRGALVGRGAPPQPRSMSLPHPAARRRLCSRPPSQAQGGTPSRPAGRAPAGASSPTHSSASFLDQTSTVADLQQQRLRADPTPRGFPTRILVGL